MEIGTYAGIALQDSDGLSRNGAVFLLIGKAIADTSVTMDGWTTRVVSGTNKVVTHGISATDCWGDAHSEALRAANNGLDYMCMTGRCSAVIRDDLDDCIVWWPGDNSNVTMRVRSVVTQQIHFGPLVLEVRDAAGNLRPSPTPPTPAVHDAFRLIRMALTSRYLFDSYRNMFLALESLLSDLRPQQLKPNGRPAETESAWFRAAMTKADALVGVASLAPPGTADPIDWVYSNVYSAQRSALMHAKPGRFLLPQDDATRDELRASLVLLWQYVRDLVQEHLGVSRGGGTLSKWAWDQCADTILDASTLVVSDDPTPVPRGGEAGRLRAGSTAVRIRTDVRYTPTPMLRIARGGIEAKKLRGMTSIGRTGLRASRAGGTRGLPDGELVVVSELTGPLTLGSAVTRFEVEVGQRNITAMELPWFVA
ncbi:hypothetical protein [Mycobacterium sp. C31M]